MPSSTDNAISYVMGYWPLQDNPKNPLDHYARRLPEALAALAGRPLIFYSDDLETVSVVEGLSRQHDIRLKVRHCPIRDLPKRTEAIRLKDLTERYGEDKHERPADFQREKGLLHLWRDLRGGGEAVYSEMLTIWLSKIDLLAAEACSPAFDTPFFAWVDSSITRFNGQRRNWAFQQARGKADRVLHYSSKMRKQGAIQRINASFLLASAGIAARLKDGFDQQLALMLDEVYPNDEETILHALLMRQPALFRCLDSLDSDCQ